MSTIVAVMDRSGFEANTDNLVLVDPERARLLWIPRDTWCPTLRDRINVAFARGGHTLLAAALGDHEVESRHSLVLTRDATEHALAGVSVLVPVPARMTFDYPLTPTARIEDGRKTVVFSPPAVMLTGERVHQWLGARGGSDLHRIERQKVFVRRLLDQQFDFGRCLARPDWYRASDARVFDDLAAVRSHWQFDTLGPMEPVTLDGRQVLLRHGHAGSVPS